MKLTLAERRARIVAAAGDAFSRRGYANTSTRDLALAAGITEPTLYKYFPSKRALFDTVVEQGRSHRLALLDAELSQSDVTAAAQLEESLSRILAVIYAGMHCWFELSAEVVLGQPRNGALAGRWFAQEEKAVAEAVAVILSRRGVSGVSVRPSALRALLITAVGQALFLDNPSAPAPSVLGTSA